MWQRFTRKTNGFTRKTDGFTRKSTAFTRKTLDFTRKTVGFTRKNNVLKYSSIFVLRVKRLTLRVKRFVLRVKLLVLRVKHLTLRVKHLTLRVKQWFMTPMAYHTRSQSIDAPDRLIVPLYSGERSAGTSYSVAAPKLWNSLPNIQKLKIIIDTFKKHLKTHYFKEHFYGI